MAMKMSHLRPEGGTSQISEEGSTDSLSQALLPLLTQGAGGVRLSKLCQAQGKGSIS